MEFIIYAIIGAGLAAAVMVGTFKIMTKEAWEEQETRHTSTTACMHMLMAENAKLRIALATGYLTEDAKKIATMTMAALSTVILTEANTVLGPEHPAFQKEPEKQEEAEGPPLVPETESARSR